MGSNYKRSKEDYSSKSSVQRRASNTKEFIESIEKEGADYNSDSENEALLIDIPKDALSNLKRGAFLVLAKHSPDEVSKSLVMALKGSQVVGFFPKPIDVKIANNLSKGVNYDCVVSDVDISNKRVKVKFKRNN